MLIFTCTFGGVTYYGNQVIAKKQSESRIELAKLDKTIKAITDRKAAEKAAAEKKAAEKAAKKKAAEAAAKKKAAQAAVLLAQLQGQVVTPAYCAISGAHGLPGQIDVIANKKHCFNPINNVPGDLVSYHGYLVSSKMEPHIDAMFVAAKTAGVPMNLSSTYRSYNDQVNVYNSWVAVNGSTAAADTVSARPGYSEHQTGFAMDLEVNSSCVLECFGKSTQYAWLQSHAADYGFVQRYQSGYENITGYSAEAWHWRYVGSIVAKDMKSKGIHTLEQYWSISGGDY